MGSSELSDALNPYFTQPRNSRSSNFKYSDNLQPVIQPSQQYAPHRSELELAISEPLSPPAPRQRTSSEGNDAMQELLRVVTQTSQAQENERKRRLAWEQEQEERHAQRQAELERQMQEMQREIYSLRSAFITGTIPDQQSTSSQLMSPTPHHCTHPSRHVQYYSPVSPIPQISDTFVQGSSSSPLQQYEHIASDTSSIYSIPMSPQYVPPLSPAPSSSARPLDSPMTSPGSVSPVGMSMLPPEKPPDNAHKGSENDCDSDRHNETRSEDSGPSRNYYQRKCRSIQEAMRRHLLRLMGVEDNQSLPDSQPEGTAYDPSQPVRFVWDKTTKQSVHNMRTKALVLEDIKQNRRLYDELPDRDFSKSILESAFEQSFTNMRQRFKAQRNMAEAENMKSRGDQRAQNSRRLSRRKKKLETRAAARLNIPIFENSTFDGALQLECMSSEESDDGADASQPKLLYTRGYLWRSSRLLRFFHALDQEDMAAPKRGSAKMSRAIGTPKESIGLPPKGVSSWMISRRWVRATQAKQPDLSEALERLVSGPPDLPPETVYQLGEESENDEEEEENIRTPQHGQILGSLHMTVSQPYSSSSLHYALA
ncbi:hypothetical protein DFH05DRAFT_1513690 [Lentinula detonsa]|uniref:Uncharacterized protein n=1 Tax=Lentinula detonsa TaxID=2804962 RepID=A0A9W8NRS6_9AGAR|nr:hypothetical protein DFH05DRAFT_1513690 [Lentinula detonsa]